MYDRYKGPMIVIQRSHGGAYIIAEMDGTVLKEKVGAFCVIPHFERYEPIELPENIYDLIDMNAEQLETMVNKDDRSMSIQGKDLAFENVQSLSDAELDSEWEDL